MPYKDLENKFLTVHAASLKKTHEGLIIKGTQKHFLAYVTAIFTTLGWFSFLYFAGGFQWVFASPPALIMVAVVTIMAWGFSFRGLSEHRKNLETIYNQQFQAQFIKAFLAQYQLDLDWQQDEEKFYYQEFMQLGLVQVFGEIAKSFDCSQSFRHKSYPYQQAFIEFETQEKGLKVNGALYIFDYPQAIEAKTILSAQIEVLVIDFMMGILKKFKKIDPTDLDESMEDYPFFRLWSNNLSHSYSIFNEVLQEIFKFLKAEELKSSTFIWNQGKLILFIQSTINKPFSVSMKEAFISPDKYNYCKNALLLGQGIAQIIHKSQSKNEE